MENIIGDYSYNSLNFEMEGKYYMAPEYINKKYNKKVDLWSLGIIAYTILLGKTPFENDDPDLIEKMINCEIYYPDDLDPEIKNFLQKFLVADPEKRMDAKEALESDFLKLKLKKKKERKCAEIQI